MTAPGRARREIQRSVRIPPAAAPSSTGSLRISPIRRGMYSGTLAMPVVRSSVEAVWRVFVSDQNGCPVISRSLPSQISGPAAVSSVTRASGRRPRIGSPWGRRERSAAGRNPSR